MSNLDRTNRELRHPSQHRSLADEFDSGDVLLEMRQAADRMNSRAGYMDCQSDLLDAYLANGVAGLKAVMYHAGRWAEFVHQYVEHKK